MSYEASRYEQIGEAGPVGQHIRRQRGLAEFEMPADVETFSCVEAPPPGVVAALREVQVEGVRVGRNLHPNCPALKARWGRQSKGAPLV